MPRTTTGPRVRGSRLASPSCTARDARRRAPRHWRPRPAKPLAARKHASGFFGVRPHLRARQVAVQSLGTHQENAVFGYGIVLGCVVGPNSAPALGLVAPPAVLPAWRVSPPEVGAFEKVAGAIMATARLPLVVAAAVLSGPSLNSGEDELLRQAQSSTNLKNSPYYLYHYTQPQYVPGIMAAGLWPGSFATDQPNYTPLQAQQALALPNPVAPTIIIPIRMEPGDVVLGPRPVERTIDPPRTGGGMEYIFPGGVPQDRLGTPYPAPTPPPVP